MKIKITFISMFFVLSAAVFAHAEQVITLKDGSQVKGELVNIKDGVYTIHTQAMGEVNVNSDQVGSIANPEAMPVAAPAVQAPSAANPMDGQIQAAQAKIMSDPQTMSDIQNLVQDPEIMQLISDPALLQAVTTKDPVALQNNPKAQALMQNPKMQALIGKLQQPQQQQEPQPQE